MPISVYTDDIVITGATDLAKLIASLYSVSVHGFESHLGGDPFMFRPVNVSPEQLYEFYDTYVNCLSTVEPLLNPQVWAPFPLV